MASSKEAVAIILDTSPSMASAPAGEKSLLDISLSAINMICQRRMFSNSKDEISLLLLGTEDTVNHLNEENGGYDHVTLARELATPDLDLLKFIANDVSPGAVEADFVDGIVVALDHLMRKTTGRKYNLRIVLFTDLASPFELDQIDAILSTMKAHNVQFTFIGPEVDDETEDSHADGAAASNHQEPSHQNNRRKALSDQQITGIRCIQHMLEDLDGEGMQISEILPMLSFFQTRLIKQTTVFRGPLEIGSHVKINVYGYIKLKEAKPSSWSKISALSEASANPGTMKVLPQRSYHLNDDDQTEVDKESEAKAYRYGSTLVPMSKMDQESLKLMTTKCLSVLGFTSSSNVKRHHYIGDSVYIFVPQPDDENASVALSSLVHALQEKDMVAIVRYCFRKNASPKLGFLTPYIKNEYEGLVFVQLPFREDLRQYTFASLDVNPKLEPSEEQLDAVDSFIDAMDNISHLQGENPRSVKPTKILNPVIQRQCQCVQFRALNPDDQDMPPVDASVQRSIEVSYESLPDEAQSTLTRLAELFPLKQVEKKKNKNMNVFSASNEDGPLAKRVKEEETDGDGGIFTLSDLSRQEVTEIGTVDPLGDFSVLLSRSRGADSLQLCQRLQLRIIQTINDSFLDQYYDKALQTLKGLREQCIKLKHHSVFNELLQLFKDTMKDKRRHDFWALLKSTGICPISSIECATSTVPHEDASKFYEESKEDEDEGPLETQPMDDVDDLVAMM